MVIRGENIGYLEVEYAICEHTGVMGAAVAGIPHPVLGEEPTAVVRLRAQVNVDEDALKAHLAARIARFKAPVRVMFADADLPRNPNGKNLKCELRALFGSSQG